MKAQINIQEAEAGKLLKFKASQSDMAIPNLPKKQNKTKKK